MGVERMQCCGALTRVFSDAGERWHEPGCEHHPLTPIIERAMAVHDQEGTVLEVTPEEYLLVKKATDYRVPESTWNDWDRAVAVLVPPGWRAPRALRLKVVSPTG